MFDIIMIMYIILDGERERGRRDRGMRERGGEVKGREGRIRGGEKEMRNGDVLTNRHNNQQDHTVIKPTTLVYRHTHILSLSSTLA